MYIKSFNRQGNPLIGKDLWGKFGSYGIPRSEQLDTFPQARYISPWYWVEIFQRFSIFFHVHFPSSHLAPLILHVFTEPDPCPTDH